MRAIVITATILVGFAIGLHLPGATAEQQKKKASVAILPWDDDMNGGGVFVAHPDTRQVVTLYNTKDQGAVLAFWSDLGRKDVQTAPDLAICALKDGVVFQIKDDAGKVHLLNAKELLRLTALPQPMPVKAEKITAKTDCGCGGLGDCICGKDCKCQHNVACEPPGNLR
jgi:hypothetical protein